MVKAPADARRPQRKARQPAQKQRIEPPRIAVQQVRQLVQRRLHADEQPLFDVAKVAGETGAVLEVGHQQLRRAEEVARGFAGVADGLARRGG